ncbi:MAG TPA: FAD-dependent monooxygenase [Planctomycetes bacterium]|nr:FAD-dependent monooxygenase [Planctomycetota bacterium]HIK82734.1 FAD-dependent monooxygenase [Planctomycetota bacterium]
MSARSVVIVGGGLTGALAALSLARDGHRVQLYERRGDIREAEVVRGRSINLAISTRGLTALERVGLKETALEISVPMRGRQMHDPSSRLSFQRYSGNEDDKIYSISRGELNRILLAEADRSDLVTLHFHHRCIETDSDQSSVTFIDDRSGDQIVASGDLIIGADGAFSAVRSSLMIGDRFDYQQDYLSHGYLELYIPPGPEGAFRIEKNALHIWPRNTFMMIALPNDDGSFTGTCFWPLDGQYSFDQLKDPDQVRRFFQKWFPDVPDLVPDLGEQFLAAQPSSLVTVRCRPWVVGNTVLIGDAAHAVVPFYGQGMNAGFEDVRILCECLEAHPGNQKAALVSYEELRIDNGHAIAGLALDNFHEMQDHVASRWFLWTKKFSNLLQKILPGWYRPLYSMVSFSNTPYTEAIEIHRKQQRVLKYSLIIILAALIGAVFWIVRNR